MKIVCQQKLWSGWAIADLDFKSEGKQEGLCRRVGKNELAASQACSELVDAQKILRAVVRRDAECASTANL
jgi:hypothetical protein